jgi:putative hydrolase of the HAD superfamily
MSRCRGVIFDLGSTLIEFENHGWDEMTSEGQRRGYQRLVSDDHQLPDYATFAAELEVVKNQYRAAARSTWEEWRMVDAAEQYFTHLGLPDAAAQGRRFIADFYAVVREQITLCAGAVEVLRELKRRGLRTGLISNTVFPRDEHEVDVQESGLGEFLDFRIYSSGYGRRKPHPEIYRAGLAGIGLPADEVCFVGDRYLEDVVGPQGVGMTGILKYRAGREYPQPMPAGITVIHQLDELLKIMEQS